jgi:hypothetical protein
MFFDIISGITAAILGLHRRLFRVDQSKVQLLQDDSNDYGDDIYPDVDSIDSDETQPPALTSRYPSWKERSGRSNRSSSSSEEGTTPPVERPDWDYHEQEADRDVDVKFELMRRDIELFELGWKLDDTC